MTRFGKRKPRPRTRYRFRPQVEVLDDRILLSGNVPTVAIADLYNTGVYANGQPADKGGVDPFWNLTAAPSPDAAGPAYVTYNNGFPFDGHWLPDSSASQWISPNPNEDDFDGGVTEPVGSYTYETTFDLTGLNPATAQITGRYTDDNTLRGVYLNGQSVGISSTSPTDFYGFHPFTISSGFVAGDNTLDFVVYNGPRPPQVNNAHNPSGLRVELSGTAQLAAPLAADTTYGVHMNQTLAMTADNGVLANTQTYSGQVLTAQLVAGPAHGSLILNPDGSFTYVPDSGFQGTDTFTYQALDATLASNVATATIDVHSNYVRPTVAQTNVYALAEHDVYSGMDLLNIASDPDNDPLAVALVSGPSHGNVTYDSASQTWAYQAATGYTGYDNFSYRVMDGPASSQIVNVHLLAYTDFIPPTFDNFALCGTAPFTNKPPSPTVASIQQGQISDCWFVAAAAGLSQANPQAIVNMIATNNGGTYTVTLPGRAAVTITNPIGDGNKWSGANGDWLAILEKGYGTSQSLGQWKYWRDPPYACIDHADTTSAGIAALTNHSTDNDDFWCTLNSTTRTKLENALDNGKVVTALTPAQITDRGQQLGIQDTHVYTVLAFNKDKDEVELRNPWGFWEQVDGRNTGAATRWVALTDFTKIFTDICYEE